MVSLDERLELLFIQNQIEEVHNGIIPDSPILSFNFDSLLSTPPTFSKASSNSCLSSRKRTIKDLRSKKIRQPILDENYDYTLFQNENDKKPSKIINDFRLTEPEGQEEFCKPLKFISDSPLVSPLRNQSTNNLKRKFSPYNGIDISQENFKKLKSNFSSWLKNEEIAKSCILN
ncbi:unnamed protein product [Blepharisma stoltei]|uniref:Uncharacterized protein n=1 Tax=Blepharisma stoltei TaxID=1481888 RepID=A0AAU9KDN6_9CILI|nr:unnamed protein product [Blepharisma stoltei]